MMGRMSVVKPEFRPTLAELLAPLPRRARVALLVVVAVLALIAAAALIAGRDSEKTVLVREPVTFNLAYKGELRKVDRPGVLLALERTRGGLFLDSYVIRDLRLPPYQGAPAGTLPLLAEGYIRRLQRRYAGFDLHGEGRTRINNGVGYQVVFRARRGRRTLYGRHLLLVPDEPETGVRRGVIIELTSTPSGTPNLDAVGNTGVLKTPLRSFRFGADRSGGEA